MIGKPLRGVTGLHPISLDIEVAPIEASNTQPITTPPAPAWNTVLDMQFATNFADTTGRHTPVSYGAVVTGGRLYANQDGRVFTDDYNGESADFDFTTKDFRVSCVIQPISIGNDYVWMKSSGGNFGICLKLGTSGPDTIIYLRGLGNSDMTLGGILPDATTVPHTIIVERIGSLWSLYVDNTVIDTATWSEAEMSTGTTGYKGFQLLGASNDNRYSGYLDNFIVQTK